MVYKNHNTKEIIWLKKKTKLQLTDECEYCVKIDLHWLFKRCLYVNDNIKYFLYITL